MNRTVVVALFLFFATSAWAGEPDLDQRLNLNLRDASAVEVLESFGAALELEVAVDPALGGKISIQLDNVSLRTTLQAVCESVGCVWRIEEGWLRFEVDGAGARRPASGTFAPLNLALADAGADEFFRSLSQILEARLELDPRIDGKFSIELQNAGLDEILTRVCTELGCEAELEEKGGARVLRVQPAPAG